MAKRIYMRHKKDNKARGFVQLIRFGRLIWLDIVETLLTFWSNESAVLCFVSTT
jgi:hypothetical protein